MSCRCEAWCKAEDAGVRPLREDLEFHRAAIRDFFTEVDSGHREAALVRFRTWAVRKQIVEDPAVARAKRDRRAAALDREIERLRAEREALR